MSAGRASLTVIHLGPRSVARADLGDGPERAILFAESKPLADGRLESALEGSPRPASRTLILDESAWTQTVELSTAALDGLSPGETARALAYELEPVSGLSAADSVAGVRRLESTPPRARLWVTQVRASARDAAQAALRARGSALAGLAHPIGLGNSGIEVWDRCTFCTSGRPESLRVIAARAGGRSWEQSLVEWLGSTAADSIAWRGRARPTPAILAAGKSIDDRGPLAADGEEFAAWLRDCAAHTSLVPVIAAARRPARRPRPVLLGAVAALLVAGLAVADAISLSARADAAEMRARSADAVRESAARAVKSRAELTKKLAETAKETEAKEGPLRAAEKEWKAQRGRPLALLRALVDRKPPGTLLASIRPESQGAVEVRGIGLERSAIDAFAAELGTALRAARWRVGPPDASDRTTEEGKRYVEFSLRVSPEPTARPEEPRSRP